MKTIINEIKKELNSLITIPEDKRSRFFKSGKGDYSEHDIFIGVKVPDLRRLAKKYSALDLSDSEKLIQSPINEERQLALYILTNQFKKGDTKIQEKIYEFYLKNLKFINNWNLVDVSAHLILGAYLLNRDKSTLFDLANSENLWKRRISIVATWYFIRNQELDTTIEIAKILLNDNHDLIHKAVGWMLREMGKKDEDKLVIFLEKYAEIMPRTKLRYSIEKFSGETRKKWLLK